MHRLLTFFVLIAFALPAMAVEMGDDGLTAQIVLADGTKHVVEPLVTHVVGAGFEDRDHGNIQVRGDDLSAFGTEGDSRCRDVRQVQ